MAGMRRLNRRHPARSGKGDFTTFLPLPIVKTQVFLLSCPLAPLTRQHPTIPGASIAPRTLRASSQLRRAPLPLRWPFSRSLCWDRQVLCVERTGRFKMLLWAFCPASCT